jgi:hypothetical protein
MELIDLSLNACQRWVQVVDLLLGEFFNMNIIAFAVSPHELVCTPDSAASIAALSGSSHILNYVRGRPAARRDPLGAWDPGWIRSLLISADVCPDCS